MRRVLVVILLWNFIVQLGWAQSWEFAALPAEGQAFRKLTFQLQTPEVFGNPFDTQEIQLWAEVRTPSGKEEKVPGFYYQPYRIDEARKQITSAGPAHWEVRYTPEDAGLYQCQFKTLRGGDTLALAKHSFQVSEAANEQKGFIRVNPVHPKYFQWSHTKETHFLAGINLFEPAFVMWNAPAPYPNGLDAAEGYRLYSLLKKRLDDLIAQGGNTIRLRLDSWWQALEINETPLPETISGFPNGVPGFKEGAYHPLMSFIIDQLVEHAAANQVAVMITSWNMNNKVQCRDYCTYVQSSHRNPDLIRRRLYYQVARWGYSPTLFAWEYFNETTAGRGVNIKEHFWQDVTAWLRQIDIRSNYRLITNTNEATIDMNNSHIYRSPRQHFLDLAEFESQDQKPSAITEGGYGSNAQSKNDTEGLVPHELLWGQLMGHRSGYLVWHVPSQLEPHGLGQRTFMPVREFLKGISLGDYDWQAAEAVLVEGLGGQIVRGMVGDEQLGLLWIIRTPSTQKKELRAQDGNSYQLSALKPGNYLIEWWDTWKGHIVERQCIHSDDGKVLVAVPDGVTRDIAAKIIRVDSTSRSWALWCEPDLQAKIYPNPSQGKFYIDSPKRMINSVEVFNLLGQRVYVQRGLEEYTLELDLSSTGPGVKWVLLHLETGTVTRKLVIL
ncbi:Por secretion system C-terminal sorting domain-containing protein [Catalinimonas alkaloidigena]|uniref:Por secretion system C-terminal sorting domain-containing protein n=1 Tax=Catalinimonas alkaloidigena TaxID=1075417 RepID=A0A1G9LHS4_9BACT|nr:T9SS type A sorting domain-containing protein [Catalinimonas alkaloidigena]SDL61446.1 Por secretion system C-terminal sorting domain-containing protein [Catalinimonas alkaloidigena]